MSSRDRILNKLRSTQPAIAPRAPVERGPVVPDVDPADLAGRFVHEAEKLQCRVYRTANEAEAIAHIIGLIQPDAAVMCWDFEQMPLPGLADGLSAAGIQRASHDDASVRVGITGVDAALAATGTLVLHSGPGKPRRASLLPALHIAVVGADQLLPDLESFFQQARQRELNQFRQTSNVTLISGPSKTADIGQELILGAHGPVAVHIVLLG